jgi:hypothetical protein
MPDGGVSNGNMTCGGRHGSIRQQLPTELDPRGTEAIAQEPEVTDAHETFGQNMKEKAA